MDIHINYFTVLAAAVAYFMIGWVWYSVLFGKVWMKLMGMDKMDKKKKAEMKAKMGLPMFFNFLANLLTCYVMAYSVAEATTSYHVTGMVLATSTAFWIWLGFIITSQSNAVLWEGRPLKLYFINISYYLVAYLAVTTILVSWP